MLQVKPIVRFSASDIKLVARTRTRLRALDRMVELLVEMAAGRELHLAVHHAHAPDDARYLLTAIEQRVRLAESYVTEFTQVMGVHTGPGLVGLAWWAEPSAPDG
jgi:fatty acid-binding protein DegV